MCWWGVRHVLCFAALWGFLQQERSGLASELFEGSADLLATEELHLRPCPGGTFFSHQMCLECPAGSFCPGNVSAPHRCPAGTFNQYTGRSSVTECRPCFPGLMSSEDRADCRLCPAGFSCDAADGTVSACPPGQHSPEGVPQCLSCPIDSACASGFPQRCGPGKEPNWDHSGCNECRAGFYSNACSVRCLPCPAGSYCPEGGTTQPLPCPPSWSSWQGQTRCRSCNDTSLPCWGSSAPRWSPPLPRSTVTCRPGTYQSAPGGDGDTACLLCPAGHYCVGGTALPCPAGTYGSKEGLQRLRDCTVCPAGFYCLEGSARRPSSQFLCPQGYYCEEGTATLHGSPCPAGTAGEQLGQTSRAACKRCREGRFCPAGSAGPGLPCARGRYCPAGTLEEVICPLGTFTPHQGAISVKDCLKCPAGFYCPEGTSDPVPCPPGSFNPLEGQDELADCRECYPGKACTQVALRAPDVDCMQGFVCPPGSSKPNDLTNACPPGTLSNRTDLTDRSQCQQCPPRYACLRGTGGIQRPPLACFAGHYCPPGTKFPTQYKCPAGTWSGHSGLEAESECWPCPEGWYCLVGAGAPSGRCSSGHFCPEGSTYGTQFPCPAGSYSIHMGNKHSGDCLLCPEGSFCQAGTSKPSPCPPSTFRRLKGGQRPEDCSSCPAGYFCPHSATVSPRVCGAGSYSDEGSVECSPCLPGHYCSNETTSEEAMLSVMVCPPGLLCSQGLSRDPQRSAALCPRGFYCPGGGVDPNPIPCPNGTFSGFAGLRDASECVRCPEGKYCYSEQPAEHPITRPTGVCPDGHYCPPGTGHPLTFPCPPGQYRSTAAGHGGHRCVSCQSGHYCDRPGIHTALVCPQGFFCPEGTLSPEPCPEGTFSSRSALSEGSECSPCGGGQYCAGVGLTEPSGSCQERFYCRAGAKSATPSDGATGGLCPAGSYCPPASPAPLPCPPGTFSSSSGLGRLQDCISCPPGFYCSGSNSTSPSGPCFPGYYCSGASDSPVQNEAEEGHYALKGAAGAQPCPPGTFQPRRAAHSCVDCQGGRLCNQTGSSRPPPCPAGHYCPPGSSVARPCPPGSFRDEPGADGVQLCRPCVAGRFCSRGGLTGPQGLCDPGHFCTGGASTSSPVSEPSGGVCPAGFVCPAGTRFPQQFPCPVGTWSSSVGAGDASSCLLCPPGLYCNQSGLSRASGLCERGFYCSEGAVTPMPVDGVTGDVCPVGHFCPPGSSRPMPCPDGTYANTTGAAACDDCPPGTYCLWGEGVQQCPAGHYCLGGGVEGILPCPPGTYSPQLGLSQVEQCLICPAGFYCEDWGLFEATGPCRAGYYCIAGVNFQNPDGNFSTGIGGACPRGKFCPEGTSLPLPCPPGTFSNNLHLADISSCSPCTPGHFCSAAGLSRPSGKCQAGFYCPGGDSTATGSEGGACPAAHYCPEGSSHPVPCPAGSYSNLSGQAACSRCPAGYYCPQRSANFTTFPCPPGFYCPDGTRHATQFPCPRGYYNPEPMTQSLDSCLPCPPGHYCEKERLTKVSGKCKAGWFCVSAAWNSQPFDLDNYTNANCLCPATSTGGRCQVGFYCPSGSSEPLPCPPGTFCNISGLALPMGPCSPGYYCVGGATQARPTDGETGSMCPPGTYCEEGSGEPRLCPAGSFSPVRGLSGAAGCRRCTAGFYCGDAGLRAPSGPCKAGYWCPAGQTAAMALPCPPGHFCPEGSAAPEPCPSGSHQEREKQTTCSVCPAGYYCDARLLVSNASSLRPCPKGHFCPAGAAAATQHPCPVGSFNPTQHTQSREGCTPCAAGHYCPSAGLSEPAGPCSAGYWCRGGASSPSPLDGLSGSLCPAGHYCPSGGVAPLACPEGTWSNVSGLRSRSECTSCPGGFFCASPGLTAPSGRCSGGYFCAEGAVSSTPTDGASGGACPEGFYCPEGSAQPLPCDPGTYVAVTHATRCEPCLAGWYCVSGSLYLCPAGHYCPEGTGPDLRSCPEGTYGPDPGYWSVSQCRQCDGGRYCSSRNASAVTGACQEGYYCSHGNAVPQPLPHHPGEGGPCPAGHYCPRASVHPLPCPRGTFSNLSKLISQEDCLPCLPGYYCDGVGLSAPSGKCRAGFFCPEGADRPDPPPTDGRGGPCPKGYYCAEGSAAPRRCPPGAISGGDGRASCSACPPGFYCPGSGNGSLYECPVGHYCPPGTWSKHQYPCPAGSINPRTQMATPQDCLPCPPGWFCASSGMSAASGECDAGYYCLSAARSATPADGGLTGDRCPEGHYCPPGSAAPLPCPLGYYSDKTKNSHPSDCVACPPGFLCVTRGLSSPSMVCPAGSYCPSGANGSLQAPAPCSPGARCPPGSHRQVPCSPGTYQNLPGQAECVKCPAGFYCDGSVDADTGHVSGTRTPTLCPKGHYCPAGTQSGVAFPCPAGTFGGQMGLSDKWGCEPCPPGTYCASSGLAAPSGLCSPGYLCVNSSVSARPQDGPTGRLCSAGSYCPQGSTYMVPCPAGTFSSIQGAASAEVCQPCLPGRYCAEVGLSSPSGPCSPGFFCTSGSRSATPTGNNTGDAWSPSPLPGVFTPGQLHGNVCPAGHYCPTGSGKPIPCPPGTFLGRSGAESEADCEACYPGSYCPSWAQTSVDLHCPPGSFCPPRSVSAHQPGGPCPAGHACPHGSAEPTICSPGTFQSSSGQWNCTTCPPGFYCTEGSSAPSPCPAGTVAPSAGGTSPDGCSPCPSGSFCNGSALTQPSGACSPGHFCSRGSSEPSPLARLYGDVCPAGYFCPAGSGSPKPCPAGSFLPEPGASSDSQCRPCPPGEYCLRAGAMQPTGVCSAGFFCSGGADSPTPRANSSLFRCLREILRVYASTDDAFFNDSGRDGGWIEAAKAAKAPPADADCAVTHWPPCLESPHHACSGYKGDVCPRGFFCPPGSAHPQPCQAGAHCNRSGLDAPAGPCAAGFHCPRGSADPQATPCPVGHYCPLGSPIPLPCPAGTIGSSPGGSVSEACRPCPAGRYCRHKGAAEPSGQCAAGFFCPEGGSSERPQQYVCSAGHYCEKGSATQAACPAGSYQPEPGRSSCRPCPAGSYCQHQGVISPLTCERGFYCPSESWRPRPCPEGTYGNSSGLEEERQCSACDPGMFCKGRGRTSPSGSCAAGFVCVGGAWDPSPAEGAGGSPCPPGFFCSEGSSVPTPCPKGTFSGQRGLTDVSQCQSCTPGFSCSEPGLAAVSGPCLPGFYCLEGSQSAAPTWSVSGGVCPPGFFCSEGSSVPSPCPAGSFRNQSGGKSLADCRPCPLGLFQDLSGQRECNPCPPGFHCLSPSPGTTRGSPPGLSSPLPCPAGYACPTHSPSSLPVPCPRGTYSPRLGLSSTDECLVCPAGQFCGSEGLSQPSGWCAAGFLCLTGATVPNPSDNKSGSPCPAGGFCRLGLRAGDCWAGFFCDRGSSRANETLCPAGFFCPSGAPVPIPCPAGTFSSTAGSTHQANCTRCTPGYHCPGEATVQPELCPVGHYCPSGLTLGREFPCPPGTLQSRLGAISVESCIACPAGSFCSQSGQSQPSGLCEAGYFCPAGSTSSNSTEDQVLLQTCTVGHYCPGGVGSPLPCPAGSLSSSRGLSRAEECSPCPAGRFCNRPAISDLSDAQPCHAGYVCVGGSASPSPTDGSHGYLCPPGHGCPVGSASERPCEPGTYSPAPGAPACLTCPDGTLCSGRATREPSLCPAGHFCPAGAGLPRPCPPGTASNHSGADSRSVCAACPSGAFCSAYGAAAPQGRCSEGFFCQGGAVGPSPQSSASFPLNGACPPGHYCPSGCLAPLPCPLGSLRNSTGGVSLQSCSSCPAGHYCSSEGLSVPSGPCAAGFYCPFDFSSSTPYAFLCQKGHYCPEGSAMALPCPTGEYQPNPGSHSCIPCRPGFYCEEAIVGEPRPCPPHAFCPAGTMVPHPCPNGTYTDSNKGGLQEDGECLPCPPGSYCRAGRIQGVCAAGYLCISGSADFTPEGPMDNMTQCQRGVQCAGPCPPGFFCPEGTEEAKQCPENTVRSFPGGASAHDCLPCPPQHWCKAGEAGLRLCPAGHYCDGLPGADFDGQTGPRPCPHYTYRASPGAGSKGDCVPCPPGSHCNSTGLTDFSGSPCPPGFWCAGSGAPILCPAGTKRPLPGAAAPSQCEPCAGGTYCPDPWATGRPNVEGIPCRASYQCPPGSVSERLCRAGSFCGPQTAEPTICPEGYMCPEGSRSYNLPTQVCPFPFYCPANSSTVTACDGGSMPVNSSALRGSRSSCCRACQGGTYRPFLSPVHHCLPCPAGFFCPPETHHYESHPCPVGYACPAAAARPLPCPPGSFGNVTNAHSAEACHPCPADTFNHLPAQKACFPCGSSSSSPPGSSSCSCMGKNRAFQHSDGSCLCRTGFVFYNELDFKSSASDSELDCQPEMNKRCGWGQARLAASRECVSPSQHSCNVTCGPRGGTLDPEMGICQCERYVSAEELCDGACLAAMPRLSGGLAPDGRLLLSVTESGGRLWTRIVKDVLGPDIHAKDIGKIHLVQFDSEGVFGLIPTRGRLVDQFLSDADLNAAHRKRREARVNEDDSPVLPRIPNPVVCLSPGDMLIFRLTINHTDRRQSHFPVYDKDHLFNSNPSWDFGVFRRLEILMKQTNWNSTRLAHVFSESGKYVLADSAVPDWSMVVVVSGEGTECDPRSPVFQPMTPALLVRYGIVKQHRLNLLPDWGVITGVLTLLLVLVVVLTTTVLVVTPSRSKLVSEWRTKPKWRSLGEPPRPAECVCSGDGPGAPGLDGCLGSRGVGEGAEAEEPALTKGGSVLGHCDLEEFNVKTLYDKLEDQNLHIASQLARHRKDTQEFYRNICQQTQTLQNVFESMDGKKLGLLRELLLHNQRNHKPASTSTQHTDGQVEALLGSVLRSVEALLCRMAGEAWQNPDLQPPVFGLSLTSEVREGETRAGDSNICCTQFSSMSMTKGDALPHEPLNLQCAAPCLSEHDLSKLVSISPLFRTLQDIQQALQQLGAARPTQHIPPAPAPAAPESPEVPLVPTPLERLPPHHSAVFLLGCQVMELLSECPPFPPVLLLLAKSIPAASDGGPAHFHFDAANQILYVGEATLQHAGRFIATVLHSMAHIASGFKAERFAQAHHQAVSALSLQFFNVSFGGSPAALKRDACEGRRGALPQEFLDISVPAEAPFAEHLLAGRLEKYRYFRLEQLISDLKPSSKQDTDAGLPPKATPMQLSCVEEEIDRINESFLRLSVELHKNQSRSQSQNIAGERLEGAAPTREPSPSPSLSLSLSRSGTILLELKRRLLSQRLDRLHSTLGHITAERGRGAPGSPAGGQRAAEGGGLAGCDLESGVSERCQAERSGDLDPVASTDAMPWSSADRKLPPTLDH